MFLTAAAACGGPQTQTTSASEGSPEIDCPAPVGTIPRESCTDIADDFGALDVSGALKIVGTTKSAEPRIEAIRAAGDLATRLKDRRVTLCEQYNACKVTPAEHKAEDERLAGLMGSLIKAWDARNFLTPDGITSLRSKVTTLSDKLEGKLAEPAADGTKGKPAGQRFAGSFLDKIEGPGLSFEASSGGVTIKSTAEGNHDALRGGPDKLRLVGGSRWLVRVTGTYTPTTPALVAPGDDLGVRLKYRAAKAGEVYVALRSLEDPDASESTTTFPAQAGATASQTASLTAAPGSSGFWLGIGGHGTGELDLDEIELLRGATVIASAHAEAPNEPNVKTSCTIAATRPLAGKASFRCDTASGDDKLTLGMPKGHLYIAIRTGSTDRAILRTLSLEGGRSVDAAPKEDADLVIGLAGPGTATIQSVEIQKLP